MELSHRDADGPVQTMMQKLVANLKELLQVDFFSLFETFLKLQNVVKIKNLKKNQTEAFTGFTTDSTLLDRRLQKTQSAANIYEVQKYVIH